MSRRSRSGSRPACIHRPTAVIDDVARAADQGNLPARVGLEDGDLLLEAYGRQHVVRTQHLEVTAAGQRDGAVEVPRGADVLVVPEHPDPRIREAGDDLRRGVRGRVVDDDDLEVAGARSLA